MKLHFKLSILLAVLFALLAVPAFASRASVNLANGGFETGNFMGWTAGNGWKVVQGGAYQGKYSAAVTLNGGSDDFGTQSWLCSDPFAVVSRKKIRFSVAFKHNGDSHGYGGMVIRYLNNNRQRVTDETFLSTGGKPDGVWKVVGDASTAGNKWTYAQFCVQAVAYQYETYTIQIDAVSVAQ